VGSDFNLQSSSDEGLRLTSPPGGRIRRGSTPGVACHVSGSEPTVPVSGQIPGSAA
jgi:hypothetical protein